MKNKTKSMKFRRRREGKTNYAKRLSLLKSQKLRIIIRKNLRTITIQIAEYDQKGDKILCSLNSNVLKKYGWNYNKTNLTASYLTGLIMAKIAQRKGITEALVDIGITTSIKGSKIYSVVKGLRDGGLKIPADEKMFPSEERIKGEHIKKYAETSNTKNKNQFTNYLKNNIKPENITNLFEETKKKIMSEN